jgi:hypothetical protein
MHVRAPTHTLLLCAPVLLLLPQTALGKRKYEPKGNKERKKKGGKKANKGGEAGAGGGGGGAAAAATAVAAAT